MAETTVRSNTYNIYKINANAHVIPYFQKLNIGLQDLQATHDGNILITKTIVKVGTANEERDIMKSKKSRRTMPLTDDIAGYLQTLTVAL